LKTLLSDSRILSSLTLFSQYDPFLTEQKIVKKTKQSEMISLLSQRILMAIELWLNGNGYSDYLKDYKWVSEAKKEVVNLG
jgi:hypothetical protein